MCTPTECRYLSRAMHLVVTVTPRGLIRTTDRRRPQALGHDLAALVDTPLPDLVVPDERPHLARLLARTRHSPAVWDRVTFLRADGRPEPLLCCFQRVRSQDAPAGAVLVTGLRLERLESSLRAEAAAAFGRLAFACHSPAHRLMQALEAVTAECPASQAAVRCRDDLDHLLDALSRASVWPDAGDGPGDGPVDAIAVIEAALELADGDPAFQDLQVVLRPEVPAAWTPVHPAALAYVTLHLASNARDATAGADEPRLTITVAADGDHLNLEFHDNGNGVPERRCEDMFAPCVAGASEDGGHAGVGLAACRQLISHLGGTIHMHSRPEEGTTVVVTVPAASPPAS